MTRQNDQNNLEKDKISEMIGKPGACEDCFQKKATASRSGSQEGGEEE